MATLIVSKDDIFKLVNQKTVYLSQPLGEKVANAQIADVIPFTKDSMDFLNTKLYEVAARILKKIVPYTSGIDTNDGQTKETIQYPYTITDDTDPTYPNSFVLQYFFYADNNIGAQAYMIQQAVIETISKYIVKEWLKAKGYPYQIYEQEFETALGDIKSAFMYGRKAKRSYHIL